MTTIRGVVTVDDEIAHNRRQIEQTEARINRIRAHAERRVQFEQGHIGYLESEIRRLEASKEAVRAAKEESAS